jgi:hypothetical protein
MFMSEKYLIVSQPEQVPPYDPKAMAEGLGMSLVGFLGPLLLELDQWLDKRLIRTLVQVIEAILTFRDRINGLVLSELGSYLDPIGQGGGTKRLSRLLHSPKWTALFIERFLWWRASEQIEQWEEQGEEGLVLWDGSVWEKPESLKSEGLGPVQGSQGEAVDPCETWLLHPAGPANQCAGLALGGLAADRVPSEPRACLVGRHALVDRARLAGQLGAR